MVRPLVYISLEGYVAHTILDPNTQGQHDYRTNPTSEPATRMLTPADQRWKHYVEGYERYASRSPDARRPECRSGC